MLTTIIHQRFIQMHPTKRERQILTHLCEGYSSKEIGATLFISPHTVETHKRNLMAKLRARNTVHLAIIAERQGLLLNTSAQTLQ